jgi:hypothetical protein
VISRVRTQFGERLNAWRCFVLLSLAFLTTGLAFEGTAHGTAKEDERLLVLKSAFLFYVSELVTWPTKKTAPETLTICLVNDSALSTYFRRALGSRTIKGRDVKVQEISEGLPRAAEGCNVLYVEGCEKENPVPLPSGPVFTIGTSKNFLAEGGMLRLFRRANRLHFDLNPKRITAGGFAVSDELAGLESRGISEEEKQCPVIRQGRAR